MWIVVDDFCPYCKRDEFDWVVEDEGELEGDTEEEDEGE